MKSFAYNCKLLFVFAFVLLYSANVAAGVSDGQPVNASTTNAAFLDKNTDTTALGKVNLNNATDPTNSGSEIFNSQRELNSLSSFTGKPINQSISYTPAWSNNDVGTSADTLKARADSITAKFNFLTGHAHTGTVGDGPQISASSISGSIPIPNGGTGVSSVTTVPAASAFAGWDANKNMSANAFISSWATTATAAGTTTLTVGSPYQQFFTGSTTQTVSLPSTATLVTGEGFFIVNNSSGVVTVNTSTANTVQAMSASSWAFFTVVSTANNNTAAWNASYFSASTPSFAGLTTNAVAYATGTTTVSTVASTGTSGQVLTSNGGSAPTMQTVSGNAAMLKAPTQQVFTSNGSQTGWLFTISTVSTVAVGDTYTNNSNTYTVQGALSALNGDVLFMSGTGATSGTTLTRATGSGTASITFSTKVATATYTTPASPSPLYLKVRIVGGGGGSSGTGTAAGTAAGVGGDTAFGGNVGYAYGGNPGTWNGAGGAGGAFGGTYSTGWGVSGGKGFLAASATSGVLALGGAGGSSFYGSPGAPGSGSQGGAIAGATGPAVAGAGGGGGGFLEMIISPPAATYPYVVGAAGVHGGAGTGGVGGIDGNAGMVQVYEIYQ